MKYTLTGNIPEGHPHSRPDRVKLLNKIREIVGDSKADVEVREWRGNWSPYEPLGRPIYFTVLRVNGYPWGGKQTLFKSGEL